jgi:RNA polymerase sigma-70 factor, ECF subfamily
VEAGPSAYLPLPVDPLGPLVARIAEGHEASVGALYDATNARVFGLALRIARDRAIAEEATIDVYTQVWRQAHRYQPSKGSVMVWLLSLARSRTIDALRSRLRKSEQETSIERGFDLTDPAPGPETASLEDERARTLRLALRSLPHEQRQALETVYFGGLTHTEAAETLRQPLGTVKTRVRMGLAALRRALHPAQDGLA